MPMMTEELPEVVDERVLLGEVEKATVAMADLFGRAGPAPSGAA
jgi:hypothetical protein